MAHFGRFGPDWREGVLSENLDLPTRRLASGTWVAVGDGGRAHFVLCSELVEVATEDGPIVGRCGEPVDEAGYACPGHRAQIEYWLSQSPRAQWEQEMLDNARGV